MSKPIVAIVGRPNVGKSTLFNRIIKKRVAIVEDKPGITRDRLYFDAEWNGKEFTLVDTGGLEFKSLSEFGEDVKLQAKAAIDEADVILFMVDAKEGLSPTDRDIAQTLRKTKKPVLLVANKIDGGKHYQLDKTSYYDFYELAFGEPIPLSAAEGINIGDLLDRVVELLPQKTDEPDIDAVRVAVIGRPNVGKSTLINAVLGEERVIVSDVPGTTRDAVDVLVNYKDKSYLFIDTAGMRKKKKISELTERYSVIRALRAIERSEISLLMIDATEGVTEQDKKIAGYAEEKGKAIILVVNKWDLIEKDDKTMLKFTEHVREELSFIQYAPVVFISALTKKRLHRVMELIDFMAEQYYMRISTSSLNKTIIDAMRQNPPPSYKGRQLKIRYATQSSVAPPVFTLFVNDTELLHFSYKRYLENYLRSTYGFEGAPIRFKLK
ncbi:MAG: ribosome biogenesis GTPase Der, partial [Desulfotomaculum sp.]|nr:ribosome biogenesis GTPase Der [Desulfotomaculum sp.]